ncbi:MAG: hypothetical protein ABSB42_08740 [Tepidisphaeraceae bacterium]
MPRKILPLLAWCLVSLALPFRALADDPFPGDFTGPNLSIEIVAQGGSYTGSIHLGQQVFPFKAQANSGQLAGTFTSNGHDYPFSISVAGDNLTFTSGKSTYQLSRNAPNPLGNPPPANPPNPNPQPPDSPPASSGAPAGYGIAAATDSGKAWVTKKPGLTTVTAALEATLPDLRAFFGGNLVVQGAFEDTRDHQSGGASFTATLAGQPIVGLITCKLGDNEAKISVTCCLASATPTDWAKLNAAATAAVKPPAPTVPLTRFDFPDGTGSVGIADGWTLKSGSVCDPLYVTGPADQSMGAAGLWWINVVKPDSPRIRQAQEQRRQLEDSYQRMGRQPPPPIPMNVLFPVVAPFSAPDRALPVVMPQWNAFKAAHNLEVVSIDRITSVKSLPPAEPHWITQLLEYDTTKNVDGIPKHFRARCTWSSNPPGQYMPDQWTLSPMGNMTAPQDTFDKDLITMQAMARSLKINWDAYFKVDEERFEARLRANQIAFDERLKDQERQRVERMKEFEEHQQQVAEEENQRSRNADDWIEYAGGYRTVIDTQTGERGQVDLSNVNGIVNSLNKSANDPNRYVQIPLRDERHPVN